MRGRVTFPCLDPGGVAGWAVAGAAAAALLVPACGDDGGDAAEKEASPTTTAVETTTTTVDPLVPLGGPWTPEEQEVVDVLEESIRVGREAAAAPQADPEHPRLPQIYTGSELDGVIQTLENKVHNQTALRYPEDSVFSYEVMSVTFAREGDLDVARLEVCVVTDSEEFSLKTNKVVPWSGKVRTSVTEHVLHKVDGRWKIARGTSGDPREGVHECDDFE